MYRLGFICVFLFACLSVGARASLTTGAGMPGQGFVQKIHKHDPPASFSADTKHNDSGHRKKSKPKGTEVTVAQLTKISFRQAYTFHFIWPFWPADTYSSFLYCCGHKRGPPCA